MTYSVRSAATYRTLGEATGLSGAEIRSIGAH
jgi:hypothetical protein